MMLTIVWDVDDVLNDLMYQWFTFCWLEKTPGCRVAYAGLSGNPPDEALGIARATYLDSLDAFRTTDRARNMQPNDQVLGWMRQYGARFRHIALTARPLESAPDVAHWVMKHFGAWIRNVGVVPTRAAEDVPVYDRTKGEYLKWLRCGDIMVDDSIENVSQAQSLGMKSLLYPQPWNRSALTVATLLKELSDLAVSP
jgi:hypothetical protein